MDEAYVHLKKPNIIVQKRTSVTSTEKVSHPLVDVFATKAALDGLEEQEIIIRLFHFY